MITLLMFILFTYGVTSIMVKEHIFSKQREYIKKQNSFLKGLFSCTTCLSFWIGSISSIIFFPISLMIPVYGIVALGSIRLIELIINEFTITDG